MKTTVRKLKLTNYELRVLIEALNIEHTPKHEDEFYRI